MDFSYAEAFAGTRPHDGYERLLLDAMVGDATLFIRTDEVQQAWRIVDPYLEAGRSRGRAAALSGRVLGPAHGRAPGERSGNAWRNPEIDLELAGGRLAEHPHDPACPGMNGRWKSSTSWPTPSPSW